MNAPEFDINAAHRWFAVEYNNRVWDLIELKERTCEETEEMVSAAHAASLHWSAVGSPLNRLRALTAIIVAEVFAEFPKPAVAHAETVLQLQCDVEDATPFDSALILAATATAFHADQQFAKAKKIREQATVSIAKLPVEEQEYFEVLFPDLSKI